MKAGQKVRTRLSNCTYECIGVKEVGAGKKKTTVYTFKAPHTNFEVPEFQLEMLLKNLWEII
jgi:hypothetical protein